jgi:CheY-like chemotaxis protein
MAKLLIVEDDEAVLRGLEGLLSLVSGHEVRAVKTAEAALDAIEADLPELIVTDVKLPGVSGLHLVEAVRLHPDRKDIPFLIISATASPEIEGQIAALENVTYLRKPFGPEKLYAAVAAAIEGRQGSMLSRFC